MSRRSEQRGEGTSVLDRVRDNYHLPLLALAVAFSLWVRTRGWQNFVQNGRVLFSGNDAWYHYRQVQYTVRNWPSTMPFDPWTGFAEGTFVGQFGTLFDQLIATAALVVGLGSPTAEQVAMVHLFAPAVFGALALIPAYLLASGIVGREGGLITVLFLSLTTGQFLTRGLVGFSDHHIAEVFFLTLAAAAVAQALRVSMDVKPVWELVTAREFDILRPVGAWSALAGLAVALYLWTWPPGVFFVGVLGVFFAVAAAVYHATGTSPDHVVAPGIVIGLVAGVLTLATLDVVELTATKLSVLQPLLGFGLAAGCVFLAGLARVWEDRGLSPSLYPVGILGVAGVAGGLFAVVLPETFDFFVNQILRIFGYDATAQSRTVAEAQPVPLGSIGGFFSQYYGFGLFTAIAGAAFMFYKLATADEPEADRMLLLVLAVFLFLAAITQRRFEYYFVVPVAVLNGYLAAVVFDLVDLRETVDKLERPTGYQVMAVLAVLMLVGAPMSVGARTSPNVANQSANQFGQASEVGTWTGSLDWMQSNTPEMGAYGDGEPTEMPYYGTYDRVDDHQYQEGEYGTLAWWDYGHWITVLGHRVPNANPFQQNAGYAADTLLAPDEESAVELMQNGPDEETRYVMVDYQLGVPGTTKYAAPTAFDSYGLDQGDQDTSNDVSRRIYNASTGQTAFTINTPRAYDSLRVRLYQNNGGAIIPSEGRTFVFDYETTTIDGQLFYVEPQNGPTVRTFPNRSAAREFVEQEGSAQIGGLPGVPSKSVPALEHFRLVHASEQSRFDRNTQQVYPAVKTFERVPGATVEVQGPPNRTVTAAVEMQVETRGSTFIYRQRARTNADGVATFTLPYASTGDDEYGVAEGYTDTNVTATGPYEFATRPRTNPETLVTSTYNATGDVSEGQVLGEDDSTTTVELTRTVIDRPEGANTSDTSDSSAALIPVSSTGAIGSQASAAGPTAGPTLAARAV